MAKMKSRYFPSKTLKIMTERDEHIQEDAKAVALDVRSQLMDWFGRASDGQIQDICSVFAGGKPNKRQTLVQKMFEDVIKEMKGDS